jgi:hypothetical protein
MKIILYLLPIYLLACACQAQAKVEPIAQTAIAETIDSTEQAESPIDSSELIIKVNRENTRRMGLSTAQVGSAIRDLIFGEKKIPLEELLLQKVEFQIARDRWVSVPLRGVIDTIYFEKVKTMYCTYRSLS